MQRGLALKLRTLLGSAVATLVLIGWSHDAVAGAAESEDWQTIVTEHFRVHFHTGTQAIAPEVAEMCEGAHEVLSPLFDFEPTHRTHVVLIDESDSANGSATVFPTNIIRLLAAPPSSDDTRNDSQNWMWELILHEYAHILHIGQVRGIPRIINWPFGRKIMPNQYLPRWFLEGVATWIESATTNGGRARNSIYDMYLRSAFLGDTVPTLAQLSAVPPDFPYATGWYLFGSSMITYLTQHYGIDPLFEAFRDYSDRLLPFAVNWMFLRSYGITADELYGEWRAREAGESLATSLAVRARGKTDVTPVTDSGYYSQWSAYSVESDTFVYIENAPDDDAIVYVDGEETDIRLTSSQPFDVTPDGKSIIIGQPWAVWGRYSYNELWQVDLETGSKTRLTRAGRAREPAVSPDGRHIVFVAPRAGRTVLVLYDRETSSQRILLDPGPWNLVAKPRWGPKGRYIYFSWLEDGGGRDLVELDFSRGTWRKLTDDRAIDDYPAVSPDGTWLYFSSDRDGIYNIYARNLQTGEQHRVTNVLSGVFAPTVVPSGDHCELYLSHYSEHGYDIARIRLHQDCSPPVVGDFPQSYVRPESERPDSESYSLEDARRYRTGWLARPREWSPRYIGITGIERTDMVGVATNGTDPAGRFSWNLILDFGVDDGQPRWALNMTFRQLLADINVRTARYIEERSCDVYIESECRPYTRARYTVGLSTSFPFRSYRASHSVAVGYDVSRTRPIEEPSSQYQLDPLDRPPRFLTRSRSDTISISYSGSTTRGYVQSISNERGWFWNLSSRFRAPVWGADRREIVLTGTLRNYQPLGERRRHLLAWNLAGGAGFANRRSVPEFSSGGFQESDVYDVIVDEIGLPRSTVRGFDPSIRRGQFYYRANIEYRFPLVRLDWGHSTLPFFFERLHGAIFVDSGHALSELNEWGDLLVSAGAELSLDVRAGYFEARRLRMGFARGLTEDGQWQFYVGFGGSF
jgi:hypothetical protein